jgi:hypothetical protein
MTAGRRYSRAAPLSNLFCYMDCPHSIIVMANTKRVPTA